MTESKSLVTWRLGVWVRERDYKGNYKEKILENDGYVYYLDCGIGFIGIYICQNLSNCTFQTCAIYYMSVIFQWSHHT